MVTRKPSVSVKGYRGDYKVYYTDRYGTSPFSGRKFKTKREAMVSARKVVRGFIKK